MQHIYIREGGLSLAKVFPVSVGCRVESRQFSFDIIHTTMMVVALKLIWLNDITIYYICINDRGCYMLKFEDFYL